jgi:ATP-dependent Clp protease protease subunit
MPFRKNHLSLQRFIFIKNKMHNEFQKYAVKHSGINSMTLHRYQHIMNGYISPTIIEERQLNVAQMDVFSRLMMDRIIFLGAAIDDDVANIIQAQLLFLDSSDPHKDIQIYLNTPGGMVHAGLGIYDTMQWISSDVATICTGMAASMGSVILAAGVKGKRSALKHSRVMIHQPSGGVQGQSVEMEIAVKEILKTKNELYSILAEHSGKTVETIEKDSDRDFWMTAEEAQAYGLVDEVLVRKKK